MNSQSLWLVVGVAVVLGLVVMLFGGSESPVEPAAVAVPSSRTTSTSSENEATSVGRTISPIVEAGPDRVVAEQETIHLDATAYDPSGGPVSVTWSVEGGLGFFSDPHSVSTSFTAPFACDCDTCVTLILTVTNRAGLTARDRLTVTVRDPIACPTRTYETSGAWVSMPTDPCHTTGEVTCPATPDEACTSPCVPDAASQVCYEIPVPCPCEEDCHPILPQGLESTPLQAKDRPKPMIDRQFSERIAEGAAVALHGSIRNPACESVCFVWSASKGWFEDADTLDPIYHAPESDREGGERVTITLTSYDRSGGRSYDQIRIQIDNTDYRAPGF